MTSRNVVNALLGAAVLANPLIFASVMATAPLAAGLSVVRLLQGKDGAR